MRLCPFLRRWWGLMVPVWPCPLYDCGLLFLWPQRGFLALSVLFSQLTLTANSPVGFQAWLGMEDTPFLLAPADLEPFVCKWELLERLLCTARVGWKGPGDPPTACMGRGVSPGERRPHSWG